MSGYYKDSPKQLLEALESVVNQTLQANEVIFVEDGKLSEPLYEILELFSTKLPLKRIPLSENRGLGNALNLGLRNCSNDIVIRMDGDDICHPERFQKQVRFLQENPEISIVGTWANDIDEHGEVIGRRTYPTSHEELYKIIWTCPFAHPTVAFRKHAILNVGSYRVDIKRRQDYDLWMRAAAKGIKFANIPEFLLYYRFTNDYYKKNNIKVAWSQAMMGVEGLRNLKTKRLYPYIGVFSPVVRAILPGFIEKPVHKLLRKVDPRNQKSL